MSIAGTYSNNSDVTVTLAAIDDYGNLISNIDTIIAQVLDEAGNELLASADVTYAANASEYTVYVPANVNTLPVNVKQAIRVIRVTIIDGNYTKVVTDHSYIIDTPNVLEVMANTYQTLQSAELLSNSMSRLDNWKAAYNADKKAALETAYNRIGRLTFEVEDPTFTYPINVLNARDTASAPTITLYEINNLSAIDFEALPKNFVNAVRRAQLVEANSILEIGESIIEKRRGGLMSETVGESSQMWRPGKPVLLSVCRETLEELSGYIRYGAGIKRA